MEKEKLVKEFVDTGFGFPILLCNVPMIHVRGEWTPKLDYNKLSKTVLKALAFKPSRLTGNEIKFVRQYFELSLKEFGEKFDVSHPGVIKWESFKNKPTSMGWSAEKDIRLFALSQLKEQSKIFQELYAFLEEKKAAKATPVSVNIPKELAA